MGWMLSLPCTDEKSSEKLRNLPKVLLVRVRGERRKGNRLRRFLDRSLGLSDCGPSSSIQEPGDIGILVKGLYLGLKLKRSLELARCWVKMSNRNSLQLRGTQELERTVRSESHYRIKFKSKGDRDTGIRMALKESRGYLQQWRLL